MTHANKASLSEQTLSLTKLGNMYGLRLPSKLVTELDIKSGEAFVGEVSDFGKLKLTAKRKDSGESSDCDIELRTTVNGRGLVFVVSTPKLVKLGWYPRQRLLVTVDDDGCISAAPECGSSEPFLMPDVEMMSVEDLRFSYELTKSRVEFLAAKVGGVDNQDAQVLIKGIRKLDFFHAEWTKAFDLKIRKELDMN